MLKPEINPNRVRVLRMGMSVPLEILLIWLPVTLLLTLYWSKAVGATEPMQQETKVSIGEKIVKTDKEWREDLSPEVYNVCRSKGTEQAFTGKYWDTKTPGVYVCAACGNELFSSETKYDSGSGWPSYWEPLSAEKIKYEDDNNMVVKRVEIQCSRCDSHLGHIFDDGPKPTGKRYCVNSAALNLVPEEDAKKEE